MSALERIRAHGGEVIRDQWRFTLRRGRLPSAAVLWIQANMEDVRREAWPAYDDWQERAAIREYDGGQDRAEAEADAFAEFADA